MKKLLTLTFILITFLSVSQAQNFLFDNNQSGFHVGGQVASYDGGNLIGIIPSYTSNGKLTISFGLGQGRTVLQTTYMNLLYISKKYNI